MSTATKIEVDEGYVGAGLTLPTRWVQARRNEPGDQGIAARASGPWLTDSAPVTAIRFQWRVVNRYRRYARCRTGDPGGDSRVFGFRALDAAGTV
jgi:hypothetical protein